MNQSKKSIIVLIIMTLIILINSRVVLADPNSSKGFLTYTDEQAEQEREELIKAQEPTNTLTEVKSTNNYLKELSVEGYQITPNFDKQTLNYELENEVKADSITIKAEVDDEKATISGIGKQDLKDGENEIKVEVTAESGTVRTYYIKAIKKANETNEKKEENTKNEDKVENKNNVIIIIGFVVLVILILVMTMKKKKNK